MKKILLTLLILGMIGIATATIITLPLPDGKTLEIEYEEDTKKITSFKVILPNMTMQEVIELKDQKQLELIQLCKNEKKC